MCMNLTMRDGLNTDMPTSKINRSREESRKEREAEEAENGIRGGSYRDDEDEDML
jgi:hypothetical protein